MPAPLRHPRTSRHAGDRDIGTPGNQRINQVYDRLGRHRKSGVDNEHDRRRGDADAFDDSARVTTHAFERTTVDQAQRQVAIDGGSDYRRRLIVRVVDNYQAPRMPVLLDHAAQALDEQRRSSRKVAGRTHHRDLVVDVQRPVRHRVVHLASSTSVRRNVSAQFHETTSRRPGTCMIQRCEG